MKILVLAPQPFFRERGTPMRLRNMLLALGEAGHEIDLLCYPYGEDIRLPNVRLIRSPRWPFLRDVRVGPSLPKIPMDALMFARALALCARRGYDVLHAVEESAFFAAWLARWFKCRLVYDMHSHISDQLAYTGTVTSRRMLSWIEAWEGRVMRAADLVITVGSALSAEVRRAAPETPDLPLEDAPQDDDFTEDLEAARRLREEFGLGNAPVVCYMGNFEGYQGMELLVWAVPLVALARHDARFVLVGGEPAQVEHMRQLAKEVAGDAHCVFVGRRPAAEMPAFVTLASVLVSPRLRGKNTPMKIYPYMLSRRLIVATALPTHQQVLDESCAILTDPTAEGIAGGVLKALSGAPSLRAIAEEARRRALHLYSLPVFKNRIREAYGDLPARPARSGVRRGG